MDDPDNEPFDPADDLRVVVAYLNSAFALRASTLLERVAREAGTPGRLICSLWEFKSLAEPALARLAVGDAKAANLIVIATQEGEALPPEVRSWLGHVLVTKQEHPRALAAVLDLDPARPEAQRGVRSYLEEVARRSEMQFYASGSDANTPLDLQKLRKPSPGKKADAAKRPKPPTAPTTGWRSGCLGFYAILTLAARGVCLAIS